ncbi:hypothetical protein [Rickettsia asembonensis]|uniref:hypothetical protein n=1 Tax=Rickettsia asembonensis TaxID=1068590 RepID=UPI0023F6FE4E|nr:hypothetical protein [Rickettsia asembonensis]WCR55964.1 MAG: hypothetical protein PG979_000021 [Rickettsia asembonensis]
MSNSIRKFRTAGDGNCFFHAVFGNKDGTALYEAKNANSMREEWHNFLSQYESIEDQQMPMLLKEQLKKIFQFFLNNPDDLTGRSEQIKKLADKTNNDIKQAEKDVKQLKDDIVAKFSQDSDFRDKIYEIINTARKEKNESVPTLDELKNDKNKLLNEVSGHLQECALEFNQNLSKAEYDKKYNTQIIADSFLKDREVYKNYLEAIGKNEYYVFFEEIVILASLADIEITVYYNRDGQNLKQDFVPNKELLGDYPIKTDIWGEKKNAVIFHEGVHFLYGEEYYTPNPQKQYHVFTLESFTDTNEEAVQKCHIKEFLGKLFGINISNETFAEMMIHNNDGNQKVTVHRSGIISSSVEQARHITPLMFIKTALKAQTQDTFSKNYLVGNFIDYILAMSNRVQGVCLTQEQYDAYHQQNDPKKVCFNIKVTTIKRDNTKIAKYLIPNESEEYKKLPEYNSDETRKDYTMLFRHYVKYVLSGLQKMLLDSHYTLETTCELMAKFILTVFNQEREKYFSTIDNILFKEIRLYKYAREAKIASNAYDSISHKEIIDRVREKEKYLGENKSPYIRIIDIKEMMIQNAVKALMIIDLLTKKNIMLHWDESDVILFESYNKDYNFKIDTLTHDDDTLANYTNYEDALTRDNYSGVFHYHAAKHLYQIFDFRSLGNEKMFALKQSKDGTRVVKVYPSDNKQLIEQYSIQSSTTAELTTESKELLTQQAISHSFLILSLFSSLSSHIPFEEDDMSPIGQIFSSFCQLLMADYSLPNTLNQEWYNGLQVQFNTEVINRLSENLDLSGGLYEQDDLNF